MDNKRELEYETQFFGIDSVLCIDSFTDCLKHECEQGVQGILKKVEDKLLQNVANANDITAAVADVNESLVSEYNRGVDYAITKIYSKLRECYKIPDNVCLEEDTIAKEMNDIDGEKLDKELEILEERLKGAIYMSRKVKDDLATVELLVQKLSASHSKAVADI